MIKYMNQTMIVNKIYKYCTYKNYIHYNIYDNHNFLEFSQVFNIFSLILANNLAFIKWRMYFFLYLRYTYIIY